FVANESSGLGKKISKLFAAQSEPITDFNQELMQVERARNDDTSIVKEGVDARKKIYAVSVDRALTSQIHAAFKTQLQIPDILYCIAGGTANECSFITDIEPETLQSCMYE
ncbi:hypothetical protein GQ43DRAFT_382764, partial [Delitschia confertaspora ATCC 74209]